MKYLLLFVVLCGIMILTGATSPPFIPVPPNPSLSVCPPRNSGGFLTHKRCERDEQCGPNKYCCQVFAIKACMGRYQHSQSSSCPPPDPFLSCFVFNHQCNNDDECRKNGHHGHCCLEPRCGRHCVVTDAST
ncbi:hypothetical protein OTU49_008546 [Cherax quadricarinatus]|uniref:WAP domain-containing protein n=1 Tax=Cherax quadricarinatus TaxID=27406 RepID=A0AAW0WRA9_CHEQU|nr:uncharacterized protein LOC128699667 [Cherax quadricarinatus]